MGRYRNEMLLFGICILHSEKQDEEDKNQTIEVRVRIQDEG